MSLDPPSTPPGRSRRRWVLAAVSGAWAVLLLGLAVVSVRQDAPTVREQRSIADARPVVDRVAVDLTAAVGDAGVMVVGAEVVRSGCRITPVRPGAELTRVLTAHTGAESGPALLDRVAQRLPAHYVARTRHGDTTGGSSRLTADAGEFVAVRGLLTAPGVLEFRISSGCRPVESGAVDVTASAGDSDDEPARLLALLGATDVRTERTVVVPCPAGGWLRSAVAAGTGQAERIAEALATEVGDPAVVVADTAPARYAYRDGDAGVVVQADGDRLRIASTVFGC
ncbi:hypothetical protein [Solwaraspora sp. WMMA2101]|uniref:hypothetical protein n=1 Tax=Solwaraspora sp. WMMA2101 TaxID=3404124 RepID=UPI003B944252